MKKIITIVTSIIRGWSNQANAQTITTYTHQRVTATDSTGTDTTIIGGANGQCFSNAVNYSAGSGFNPHSAISGDFNNDGFIDIVADNYGTNAVTVLLGTGLGTFGAATSFTVCTGPNNPSNFSSICSADFNADGFKDLAVASVDNLYVLLGTGTGSFGASTIVPSTFSSRCIISNDFNMDGKADLAMANYGSNNVCILLGTGTGSFGAGTNFPVSAYPMSIISGDFNGDSNLDLAVANSGSNSLSVLLGTGTGSFGAATNFPVFTGPLSITSADFNNDGILDLAATDGAGTICAMLGTGSGSFGAPANNFTAGWWSPYQGSIVSADFNMDGNVDLATADYGEGSGYASVYLGTGTGSFGIAGNFATGSNPWTIMAADFNMDGKPDLATSNSSNNISILLNTPMHVITIASSATSICPGRSIILTASGSTTYGWSMGATAGSVSVTPTVTTTYSVSDGVGCSNTESITINVATTSVPDICMVTTDSSTNYMYNIVYWDKTGFTNVDSFIIYRYNPISVSYARIGAVSNNALSEFTDTEFSIGGPNGGNPAYGGWKYKLALRDTCGNIGAMSPFHQTMFVQQNNSNFSWNAYEVETGQTNPVTGYSVLRDDNNTGNFQVLANLANTSTSSTDPNYALYPNGNWRIDAIGFNCTTTAKTENTYSKSHSNTTKLVPAGIYQISNPASSISVYPNPATNSLTISGITGKATIKIHDVLGNIVYQTSNINISETIDITSISNGVYFIQTIGNDQVYGTKFVKE